MIAEETDREPTFENGAARFSKNSKVFIGVAIDEVELREIIKEAGGWWNSSKKLWESCRVGNGRANPGNGKHIDVDANFCRPISRLGELTEYNQELRDNIFIVSELRLETLESGIPALTSKRAGVHMEACIWCLIECGHNNGARLEVIEQQTDSFFYKVTWPNDLIDIDAIYRAYNKDDGPEDGAVAIALLLIREKTDYTAIRRSVTRTGIDYWLGNKSFQKNQIFGWENARLEVSGILKETSTNKVKYRIPRKIKQSKQSDDTSFPAYIVVVEFSKLYAKMVLRNV